ncbi:MAG: ABC transporter substrate-binding protein [Bacillota bacterium]|jgi:branched-chain amino acid transport system substrate-binding protein
MNRLTRGRIRIRTILALVALAAVIGAAASGCGGRQAAKVIKIGLIAPMTGDVKTFGESTKNGFMLALEEAGMKVAGFDIVPVFGDDRNDPTESVNVATKLATQDGVKAIIGSVSSKCSIPVSEVCQANKVVQITPTSTNPRVTVDQGARKSYVFRACFIDPFQGTVAAKFALQTLGAKTAAVLFDQANDYTIGLANYFRDAFTAGGGEIVAWEAYSKDDVDFSAQLTKVARLNPDILYLPDYYTKVNIIAQQARAKRITSTFLGGDGWDSSELDFETMEGGYFTNHYSAEDSRPEVQAWVAKYRAKYGSTPDALATLAYDATKLLLAAIEAAGSDDPTAIRDALQAIEFDAVSGRVFFDADGNPIKAAVVMQISGGNQKYVETVSP